MSKIIYSSRFEKRGWTIINNGTIIQNSTVNHSRLDNALQSPATEKHNNTKAQRPPKISWLEILSWISAIIATAIGVYEFILKNAIHTP